MLKVTCGALTLLSMTPMMLGPWDCSRLSWLTGWRRIRFFIISRKEAILFLSSLLSKGQKRVDQIFRFPATQSHMSKLQYILLILSYRDESLLICLVSVWLSVLYLHQSMQIEHWATKLPFCKQMLACKLLLTQSLLWLLYVTEWGACMALALPVYSCIMHHMHDSFLFKNMYVLTEMQI